MKAIFSGVAFFALLSTSLAGAAQAASVVETETYIVPPGAARTFQTTYMTMSRTCRPVKPPQMSLAQKPRYGTVTFIRAPSRPSFAPGSDHAHCNSRTGTATAIVYRAPRGGAGQDAFVVRIRFNDGEVRYAPYVIQIQN